MEGFLLSKLQEMKLKRSRGEQTSIFTEQDLDTLFDMYAQEAIGGISKESCLHALRALQGAKCNEAIEKLGEFEGVLSKEEFVGLCTESLG